MSIKEYLGSDDMEMIELGVTMLGEDIRPYELIFLIDNVNKKYGFEIINNQISIFRGYPFTSYSMIIEDYSNV